jgi:hypothetical protein
MRMALKLEACQLAVCMTWRLEVPAGPRMTQIGRLDQLVTEEDA